MKLIDLLVKELPKRGGWPEGAIKIHQDYDGETWAWLNNGSTERLFTLDQVAVNARKFNKKETCENMVTREQYEAALTASKAIVGHNGWIDWQGGECPVDNDAIIEVIYRKTNLYQYNNDRAGDFSWSHDGSDGDIIAYRLHTPDVNNRAIDDQLEQDLNECIGQGVGPTWNGDGLPPVGIICEAKVPRSITGWEWREVKVVESGIHGAEKEVLVYDLETTFPSWTDEFRPLRTEAERKREAAAKEMARHANSDQHRKFNAGLRNCLSIYDAIAAGKIPGVKLEGK